VAAIAAAAAAVAAAAVVAAAAAEVVAAAVASFSNSPVAFGTVGSAVLCSVVVKELTGRPLKVPNTVECHRPVAGARTCTEATQLFQRATALL
jgi:hypothetical protein